ncbi:hypothetical protein GCM10027037_15280 [Mucilaginibacter koreensis]
MTLFSHVVSELNDENYSEPRLLSLLLQRAIPATPAKTAKPSGWLLHYATGTAFSAIYKQYLNKAGKKPNVSNGLAMGAISGVAGIAMWKSVFTAHPWPPKISHQRFFAQLFVAHLIFGVVTAETMRLLEKDTEV